MALKIDPLKQLYVQKKLGGGGGGGGDIMNRFAVAVFSVLLFTGCPEDSGGGGNSKLADGSFDGVFSGAGKVSAQGLSLNCESVRIAIDTDDETYFNVSEWTWNCGGYVFANSPVSATIKNGEVMVNGENYGSMSNSTISLEIEGDGAGELMKLNASAFENSLQIREEYNSSDGQAIFTANLPRIVFDEDGCGEDDDCVVIEGSQTRKN
jgi:hypothetical protein